MATFAQIQGGLIVNTISVAPVSSGPDGYGKTTIGADNLPLLNQLFGTGAGFDAFVQVDNLVPEPGNGWYYAAGTFTSQDGTQTVTVAQ